MLRGESRDQLLDSSPCTRFGHSKIVVALQVKPELRLHLEVGAKPQRRVGGNGALAAYDGADARRRHAEVYRQLVLADSKGYKEFFFQDFARMYQVLRAHFRLLN